MAANKSYSQILYLTEKLLKKKATETLPCLSIGTLRTAALPPCPTRQISLTVGSPYPRDDQKVVTASRLHSAFRPKTSLV
jgi:hypothetical protein